MPITHPMMVHAPPCSPAPPGWQIQMCRCKKVSQHSLKNVEEMDHTSRTGIYSSVQGSKGGALPESSTMTSDGLLEHFSDKQTPWGTWELNIPCFVRPVLTDQYCAAQVEFTRRHWHLQVYQWCLTFFIDESICTLSTFDRHQRICGKHYAACNIISNDL